MTNNTIKGTYHLANNPKLYSPQRAYNYEFYIMDIDNLKRLNTSELDENREFRDAAQTINYSLVSTTVPSFTQDKITIPYGNNKFHYAGRPTWNELTVTINDFIGAQSKDILYSWQALAYNALEQGISPAGEYKKICYLHEYDSNYKLIRSWKIVGCFPLSVTTTDFSMENEDKKTVSMNLSYDYAILEAAE